MEDGMRKNRNRCHRCVVVCVVVAAGGVAQTLRAAPYLLDINYAGTNGAPFGDYAVAYNNVSAALVLSGGIPTGASASKPQSPVHCAWCVQRWHGLALQQQKQHRAGGNDF